MSRIAVVLLAALFLKPTTRLSAEQDPKPLPSIEVTAPNDVKDVQALNDTLSTLSQKVTACVKAGRKPEDCQCGYPGELNGLTKGYESVIKKHPEWKDQILSYQYHDKEGHNISGNLVLQNLRRQLEALKCK